jgi:hypothetical protein
MVIVNGYVFPETLIRARERLETAARSHSLGEKLETCRHPYPNRTPSRIVIYLNQTIPVSIAG